MLTLTDYWVVFYLLFSPKCSLTTASIKVHSRCTWSFNHILFIRIPCSLYSMSSLCDHSVESLSNHWHCSVQNKKVHNKYWHIVHMSHVHERYSGRGWLKCWGHNCTLCYFCPGHDSLVIVRTQIREILSRGPNPGHNAPISLSPWHGPAPCWLLLALFSLL